MARKIALNRRDTIKAGIGLLTAGSLAACSDSHSNSDSLVQSSSGNPTSSPSTWEAIDIESRLDADVLAFYDSLPALDFSNPDFLAAFKGGIGPLPFVEGMTIEDVYAPGYEGGPDVLLRVFRPDSVEANAPALLNIHGGGFIFGAASMDDARNIHLAQSLNTLVVSPNYRLAPEDPFPAGINDCYAALLWMAASTVNLGIDATRIAIGGQSGGGGIAAGLALMARDLNGPQICLQLLVYPMLDDRNETPSSFQIANSKTWSRKSNIYGWDAYLSGNRGADDVSPWAAPARATDLSNLPPAVISVGTADLFLDEDIAYAQALSRAGVLAELHVYPGVYHGADITAPDAGVIKRWQSVELLALENRLRKV